MASKIKKYVIYTARFINSPDKKTIFKELGKEMKEKGTITGIRSYLHKKEFYMNDKFRLDDSEIDELSIKDYSKTDNTMLPISKTPKVSIIIPMYNEVGLTYNCINAIYENNEFSDYEIIVADDHSPDDSSILKERFQNFVIHRNETNLGFLKNCNAAAKLAKGEFIVFLNNDTQVQKKWLEKLLYIFDNFKNAGIVGSKLLYPDGLLQEAGGILWQDGSAWNYGNGDKPGKPEYCYVKEVDYISGASFMIRASLWKEIGGFDERFAPAYCEDSDLCFQARSKGYKVIYQPFSKVIHFEGISHGKNVGKGVKKYQAINQKKFYEKWYNELRAKSKSGENVFSERERSTKKKHILVIDHYLPEVDKDAGSRTISNYMEVMIELGYSVKFLGENDNTSKRYRKIYQQKGVEVLYGNEFNFTNRGWENYLAANLQNYEAILLSRAHVCTPILQFLRGKRYRGNIIYYGHDLGYLSMEKEALLTKDISLYKQFKVQKAKEDYMYENANNSLVCSMKELDYMKAYIPRPLHYIPPYYFDVEKNGSSYEEREGLLFVGGFNHPPNQDAMKWFLEEIYEPLDKKGIPLTIAGSKIPEFIFNYKDLFHSLTILPDVSAAKLNELYAKARIAIVPLRHGAGVKGKVIEAMAKGVPVVGTESAFEGMPKDSKYLYHGHDTAEELTDDILQVYSYKERWEKLSAFGKEYVSDNFNKENMKSVFKRIITTPVNVFEEYGGESNVNWKGLWSALDPLLFFVFSLLIILLVAAIMKYFF